MYIYALVGPSGTGKSHRALWVAKEHNIEYVIDDGLLIKGNAVLAGKSAKREQTRIGAVKTAVLTDDQHAFEISRMLKQCGAERLLILGTSDGMVKKIAGRLGFPGVDETIYIQDISTPYEIQQALQTRRVQGKHVIPVPTMELKKDFSGLMLDPLNILRKKGTGNFENMGEKSVIRPTYSYLGKYTISDYTIYQLVEHVTLSGDNVYKITRFRAEKTTSGIRLEMDLVLYYGCNIPQELENLRGRIIQELDTYTSLNTTAVVLTVQGIVLRSQARSKQE
ncbi:MAG: Asp23/Gls24 family envelope stress response protein [Clostridia bacterium]|nr:Asp23/Gls24 family envelope stress response protein [Clostridia bacterium]